VIIIADSGGSKIDWRFLFKNGEELKAASDTCLAKDGDDELFPFKTSRLILLQPYLPCFAVR
jgi:hypothetical protein